MGEDPESVKTIFKSLFLIVTYFTSWNVDTMPPFAIPAKCLTHVNYAFAKIENGSIVNGDDEVDIQRQFKNPAWKHGGPEYFNGAIEALTHPLSPITKCNPNLKKLISIGGWNDSGQFSIVSGTAESRAKFATSVIDYLHRHRFDGIDFDWEYPVEDGLPTNARSPDDKENFVLLLKEVRSQMDSYQKRHKRSSPFLITAATSVTENLSANLDLEGMAKILNWFNLMIYDFAGPWENVTAHNAPFNPAFIESVNRYLERNVPSSKIVTGVPLYAVRYHNVSGEGPGFPYESVDDQIGYDVLQKTLTPDLGYDVQWDRNASAGYLWNEALKEFVTYENPQSVLLKTKYAVEHNLAGMFTWEASYDRDGVALGKILQRLGKDIPTHECFCKF